MIPRVLSHARSCKCVGSMVVPEWPSAVFWPLICNKFGRFAEFIKDWFYLPLAPGLFVSGKQGACLFKDGVPTSNVMVLRLDFTDY